MGLERKKRLFFFLFLVFSCDDMFFTRLILC